MTRKPAGPARQRPSNELGVLPWQRDFWLLLIAYAQSGQPGPPDLSSLAGVAKPAVTRFAVTTPDLLRGFRKFNQGKPYHGQVRPFGFMLLFQEDEELMGVERPNKRRASSMLRIISPFDRDPLKAAKKAFDRDSGDPVPARKLKTYARALRGYHAHAEAKFLNGGPAERGPTQRRHVIVRSIRHIGKEANRLDAQLAMGVDPAAQAEYGDGRADRKTRIAAIRRAVKHFGLTALARGAGVSRQHLSAVIGGRRPLTISMLERLERAAASLEAQSARHVGKNEDLLETVRQIISEVGLRKFAEIAGIDAGHLSRVLAETRVATPTIIFKMQSAIDAVKGGL